MEKQLRFELRLYPNAGSINGIVLSYLQKCQKEDWSRNEKIMQSILAFWLPFAAAEVTDKEEEEIKALALSSINRLQCHIQYLREVFKIAQPTGYFNYVNDFSVAQSSPVKVELDELSERSDFSEEEELLDFLQE